MKIQHLLIGMITILLVGMGLAFNAARSLEYRVIQNPRPARAADYQQARYLKMEVLRPGRNPVEVKVLLALAEYFSDEEIELDQGRRLLLGKVIEMLKQRGKLYMVEISDREENETLRIWLSRE